jgi:hypothetical protein
MGSSAPAPLAASALALPTGCAARLRRCCTRGCGGRRPQNNLAPRWRRRFGRPLTSGTRGLRGRGWTPRGATEARLPWRPRTTSAIHGEAAARSGRGRQRILALAQPRSPAPTAQGLLGAPRGARRKTSSAGRAPRRRGAGGAGPPAPGMMASEASVRPLRGGGHEAQVAAKRQLAAPPRRRLEHRRVGYGQGRQRAAVPPMRATQARIFASLARAPQGRPGSRP